MGKAQIATLTLGFAQRKAHAQMNREHFNTRFEQKPKSLR